MTRPRLLLTGAAGGMGRACARLMGATHDLILTDVSQVGLKEFAKQLNDEGYCVLKTRAGDLGDAQLLSALVTDLGTEDRFTLIHTAGLSPTMADWQTIMHVNLVVTARLLDAVEPALRQGCVAVLVASVAGHMMPQVPDWQALMDRPLEPSFLQALTPIVENTAGAAGAPGVSYSLSKQAVIRLVEQRALAWGQRGARIASISPGLILTPMGRKEVAETTGALETLESAPVGRPGRAIDIALAAQFLISEQAGFITGTDLRVDGGSIAAIRLAQGAAPA